MTERMELGQGSCANYEALLEDYLNGELSVAGAKIVEMHCHGCAACRRALESAAATVRLLRLAGPTVDPGPGFSRDVMARIHEAEGARAVERAGFWQPLVSLGWRFAATAALVLVGLVTYDARWGHRAKPEVASARLIGVSDLFAPDPGSPPADRDEVLMMVAETSHGK